jgi:hypothetical protein
MKKFAALQLSLIFAFVAFAATPDADLVKLAAESLNGEQLEEMGISEHNMPSAKKTQRKIHLNRLGQVLLIPESGEDVVGMYDPYDGTYLGDLIIEDTLLFDFSTPINAVPGPDNNIYVSDQLEDAVYVFDTSGAYLYTYADASDGLNNIRGIDFRNGHLFVTSGDDYVREFSAPHTVVRDFIADGSDPFDILFLEDGRSLLCDIQGTTDNVRLYDTSGTFLYQLFPVNFPEQVQFDDVLPGAFLTAAFSANTITDFELDGTIIATIPFAGNPRGVYRLGNGNLLGTNGAGIHELDPVTGAIIQTENTGSGRFIELYTAPAAQTYFWDFEDGEQGWTHTNGGTFPAAWDVVSSSYVVSTYTIAPPDAGDSSFCIDGYLGGICHDTAMSPVVDNPGFSYFKWGMHFQQYVSYQTFTVIMRTFSSGVWNAWTDVWTYTADTPPRYDSVDISGTVADSVQVGFVYDQPNATYAWFAAFDNVVLIMPPSHDVGCTEITSPPAGRFVAPGDYDVIGRIRNFGPAPETFDAVATVYDTLDAWTVVFTQTVTFTDLPAAADSLHNFGTVTFEDDKIYFTEIYTALAGDVNTWNDTTAIFSSTETFDLVWDFETGWQGWTHTNADTFPFAWDVLASEYIHPNWTPPDAGDSCMWIDSDSAGTGVVVEDSAWSRTFAPNVTTYWLMYGLGYNNLGATSDSLYVGIRTCTSGVWNPPIELIRYSADYGPAWDSLDVSAYNAVDSMQIYFYYSGLYDWYAAFDNVMINGDTIPTGISERPGSGSVAVFGFAPGMSTVHRNHVPICYSTTAPSHVSLKVYDNTGRLVRTLVDTQQPAGEKSVLWDNKDLNKRTVANGVYFLKLEAQGETAVQKLVFLK